VLGSIHDLLLRLLEQAASGDGVHVRGRGKRAGLEGVKMGRPVAREPAELSGVEALAVEGLIELRCGVYRATAAGVKALEARGRVRGPAGSVAVMFTDIEGSTRLLERLGDAAALAIVRRHFALLRAAVDRHRGHEVKSLGDGLMVVFEAVDDAVECAAAMQAAVACEGEGVGLRIGIHAGEPVREENDYFGTPVIIARRLCDTAAPGQTLVSQLVSRLVAEHEFESLGGIALKGLSEPVTASALAGKGHRVCARLPATAIAV
jgi:class 3 adenylate cyclase